MRNGFQERDLQSRLTVHGARGAETIDSAPPILLFDDRESLMDRMSFFSPMMADDPFRAGSAMPLPT